MIDPPQIVSTEAVTTAMIRITVARDDMPRVMGPAFGELFGALGAQGIAPAGPAFAHHLRMDPGVFDFELSVAVATPVTPVGRVQPGRLPAAPAVARTIHHGRYEGLSDAWGELTAWIASQGRKPAGDLWEVYAVGPGTHPDPADWRTELNRPLR